jgi:hypothetical protein
MTENMTQQNNSEALLQYLVTQANSGNKNWFGFQQQRIAGINLAYKIAERHADKMSPEEITDYVVNLNNSIYRKLIEKK